MPLGSFGELNSPVCCTDMEFTSAALRQQRQQARQAHPEARPSSLVSSLRVAKRAKLGPGLRLHLNVAPCGPPGRYADILLTSVSCDRTGSGAEAFANLFTASDDNVSTNTASYSAVLEDVVCLRRDSG